MPTLSSALSDTLSIFLPLIFAISLFFFFFFEAHILQSKNMCVADSTCYYHATHPYNENSGVMVLVSAGMFDLSSALQNWNRFRRGGFSQESSCEVDNWDVVPEGRDC